jgi:hypothetical protein
MENILKSTTTRDQVVEAVEREAQEIAKRDGISYAAALAKAWATPGAYEAHETLPLGDPMRPDHTVEVTRPEVTIEKRCRVLMAEKHLSYPAAFS